MADTTTSVALRAGLSRFPCRQSAPISSTKNKRLHLALGVAEDGSKDILDFWLEDPRAEQFWPNAVAKLRQRGLHHIDIAMVEEPAAERAIRANFPTTLVCPSALTLLPPALQTLCASISAVESVVEKRRRRGLSKPGSFASGDAAVRDLLFVLQDAPTSWKVSPARWFAARAELLTLRHALATTV